MAKLQGTIEILVYNDAAATNKPQKRIGDLKYVVSDDAIIDWMTQLVVIPTATLNQVIPLGVISARYLVIQSDQDISVKLNGSLTAMDVKKNFPFIVKSTITSLTVSNASGADANVEIMRGV